MEGSLHWQLQLPTTAVEDITKSFKTCLLAKPDLVRTACGGELDISHSDQAFVTRNLQLLITSLSLAVTSLEDCQLTSRTPLVRVLGVRLTCGEQGIIILKLHLSVCLYVRPGVQRRSRDLDSLVAIMSHGAGWKQRGRCHRERLLPRC